MKPTPLCTRLGYDEVAGVVNRFYRKVLADPQLAPYFDTVEDWPAHERYITDFWWGLMGGHVNNPRPHAMESGHRDLAFGSPELEQWLALFAETVQQSLKPELAERWTALARQLGDKMAEKGMLND